MLTDKLQCELAPIIGRLSAACERLKRTRDAGLPTADVGPAIDEVLGVYQQLSTYRDRVGKAIDSTPRPPHHHDWRSDALAS